MHLHLAEQVLANSLSSPQSRLQDGPGPLVWSSPAGCTPLQEEWPLLPQTGSCHGLCKAVPGAKKEATALAAAIDLDVVIQYLHDARQHHGTRACTAPQMILHLEGAQHDHWACIVGV